MIHLGELVDGKLVPMCLAKSRCGDRLIPPIGKDDEEQEALKAEFNKARESGALCPTCLVIVEAYEKGLRRGRDIIEEQLEEEAEEIEFRRAESPSRYLN